MNFLYRIYQIVVALPVVVIASVVCSLATVVGCLLGNASWWGYWPGRVWAVIVCRILLLPIRVEGRHRLDPDTSYVFVSNHQSYLDIFLIYGFLGHNFRWMMKRELRSIPFIGLACERAGEILIDRSSPARMKHSLIQAEKTLQGGTSLVVYPAAGLVQYVRTGTPVYLIDPKPVHARGDVHHIMKGASAGMKELFASLVNNEG